MKQYVYPYLSSSNRTVKFFYTVKAFDRGTLVLIRRKKLFYKSWSEKFAPSNHVICRSSSEEDSLFYTFLSNFQPTTIHRTQKDCMKKKNVAFV